MAVIQYGIGLLFAAVTVAGMMTCPPNKISWADVGFDTNIEPFASEPHDHCCDPNTQPQTDAELQDACHLCYDLTKSTPGFARDVADCSKFYMCEPNGKGGFTTFHMNCSKCSFWDQDLLTCVQVWFDVDECVTTGHQTDQPVTGGGIVPDDGKLFCINFESQYQLADNGVYVYNDSVGLVQDDTLCPIPGSQCGHFLGANSRLEVPFFSNNYDHYNGLVITFHYRRTGGGSNEQGIFSNDCFPNGNVAGAAGNSLFCSVDGSHVNAGMKDPTANVDAMDSGYPVVFAKIKWQNNELSIELRQNNAGGAVLSGPSIIPFPGPIRNSHCPLVIGSFINNAAASFFEGYMDDICFYKWE